MPIENEQTRTTTSNGNSENSSEEKDRAEQLTYEQSFLIKTMNGKTSEIQYFKNIESTKAGPETAADRS